MGKPLVTARLWNLLKDDQVKAGSMVPLIVEALADTGATYVLIPKRIADQLGLPSAGTRQVRYADGRTSVKPLVGALVLEVEGRTAECRAIVEPNGAQVLIGQLALGDLDLYVDGQGKRLVPRSDSPDMPVAEAYWRPPPSEFGVWGFVGFWDLGFAIIPPLMEPQNPPLPAVGPGTSTIKQEFQLARQVLMSVMPRGFETDAFGFDLRYNPMIGIGGDHAAVERYPDGCLFTISDVTGHGIAAALMVRDVCGFIRAQAASRPAPGKLVAELNKYILKVFADVGIFMTFFCGALDFKRRELVYCGAGHPPLMLAGPSRPEPLMLSSANTMLGVVPVKKAVEARLTLEPGDRIIFYTDGVFETRNPGGEEFGLERLARAVHNGAASPLGEHLDAVIRAADAFRGDDRQRDDVLVAGIHVYDPAGSTRKVKRPKS